AALRTEPDAARGGGERRRLGPDDRFAGQPDRAAPRRQPRHRLAFPRVVDSVSGDHRGAGRARPVALSAQRSCRTLRSISAIVRTPHNTIVKSSSRRISSSAVVTPASPRAPSPYTNARPIITARAPSASAFNTSWPERTPPSSHTSQSRPTRAAISGSTLIDDGAP